MSTYLSPGTISHLFVLCFLPIPSGTVDESIWPKSQDGNAGTRGVSQIFAGPTEI